MEAGETPLVVLASAGIIHLDVLHVHFGKLINRLLDLTETSKTAIDNTENVFSRQGEIPREIIPTTELVR